MSNGENTMLFTTMTKLLSDGKITSAFTSCQMNMGYVRGWQLNEKRKGWLETGKISIPQPYLVKKYKDELRVLTKWIVRSLCTEWDTGLSNGGIHFQFYVSVNNAWKLYIKTSGNKVRMLNFLRGVVVQLVSVLHTWIWQNPTPIIGYSKQTRWQGPLACFQPCSTWLQATSRQTSPEELLLLLQRWQEELQIYNVLLQVQCSSTSTWVFHGF